MLQDKPSMVLPHHPDLATGTRGMWAIGFWRPTEAQIQSVGEWNSLMGLMGVFLKPMAKDLPSPQDFVDPTWDLAERDLVIQYLRRGRALEHYKGYSNCRFKCGIKDSDMGDADLTDGTFVWPEGFAHYLQVHNVRPDERFIDHVLKKIAGLKTRK